MGQEEEAAASAASEVCVRGVAGVHTLNYACLRVNLEYDEDEGYDRPPPQRQDAPWTRLRRSVVEIADSVSCANHRMM